MYNRKTCALFALICLLLFLTGCSSVNNNNDLSRQEPNKTTAQAAVTETKNTENAPDTEFSAADSDISKPTGKDGKEAPAKVAETPSTEKTPDVEFLTTDSAVSYPTDADSEAVTSEIVVVDDKNAVSNKTETAEKKQTVTGELKVSFIDVGQGDSIFISLPNGKNLLIDAGEASASKTVIQTIKDNKTKQIDYLIATHPHSDHIGGIAAVLKEFDVKSVWLPEATNTTQIFENLLDAIEEEKLSIDIVSAGTTLFDFGNLKAVFIAPRGDGYKDLNNYSAVLMLTYGDRRFLFMGDAEDVSEKEILASKCDVAADVLKVGHHGSSSSSTKAFISAVSPKYAVISCGKDNSYGHPTKQTLTTLVNSKIEVLRTDEKGTIVFTTDGKSISYKTFGTEIQPRAPTDDDKTETAPKKRRKRSGGGRA